MQSDLLDVVIGVVFTWFLLSMVLSAVHEGFSLATHSRAKNLWLGIGRLFDPTCSPLPRKLLDIAYRMPFKGSMDLRPKAVPDPAVTEGDPNLKATIIATLEVTNRRLRFTPGHWTDRPNEKMGQGPRVVRAKNQLVYQAVNARLDEVAKEGRLSKVTKVPAAAFSEALIALARKVSPNDLSVAAADLKWDTPKTAWLAQTIPGLNNIVELEEVTAYAGKDAAPSEEELRQLYLHASLLLTGRDVAAFVSENPALASAVKRAAAAVGATDRAAAVRKVVESWFDGEMNQLSTFYRRQSRKILLLLAIPLVLVSHANSITVFENLRRDASLRQAALSAATAITGPSSDAASDLDKACARAAAKTTTTAATTPGVAATAVPTAGTTAPSAATAAPTTTTSDPVVAAGKRLTCARDLINDAAQFRVGLAWEELKAAHTDPDELRFNDVGPYLRHALIDDWGAVGRAVTLLALIFGAQFWFDVLRRLIGLRQAMKGEGAPRAAA